MLFVPPQARALADREAAPAANQQTPIALSRDLRELGITKKDGYYVLDEKAEESIREEEFKSFFQKYALDVLDDIKLIGIRTQIGFARAVAPTEQELTGIKGIGKAKARQIVSAMQLARTLTIRTTNPYVIRSPKDVWQLLAPEMAYLQKEHFFCLFLNTKNHVIAKETVSIGSLSAAIVHPREVFRAAIKRAAASIICAHNHLSGDPTPSHEDVELTKRLFSAGEIVGIEILDHVVVGHDRFYSLKEHGLM